MIVDLFQWDQKISMEIFTNFRRHPKQLGKMCLICNLGNTDVFALAECKGNCDLINVSFSVSPIADSNPAISEPWN